MLKRITVFLCLAFVMNLSLAGGTKTNQIDSLLAGIPSIWLHNPDVESFYVKGVLSQHGIMKFCVAGQKPNDISMVISDENDVPILIAKNDNIAMYEPISGELVHAALPPVFQVKIAEHEQGGYNEFIMHLGLLYPKAESTSGRSRNLCIDVPSLLTDFGEIESEQLANGHLLIKGKTEKGNPITVRIGESGIKNLSMSLKGISQPIFSMDTIILNESIPHEYFKFPVCLMDEDKFNISKVQEVTNDDITRLMTLFFLGNVAVEDENPEKFRAALEQVSQPDIDFEKLSRSKLAYAQTINSVFKDETGFLDKRVDPGAEKPHAGRSDN